MKVYFTVYKITNRTNKKFYHGSHRTKRLDDGYMGSGKLLKRAFKKYGMENFDKEILAIFETSTEMFAEEARIVEKDNPMSYNLKEGGSGGFDHLENRSETHRKSISESLLSHWKENEHHCLGVPLSEEHKQKISMGNLGKVGSFLDKKHTTESKNKIGKANSGKRPWNKGCKMSEETKRKISQSMLAKKEQLG